MKLAKSYKIKALIVALALSLIAFVACFYCFGAKTVKADSTATVSASSYFSLGGDTLGSMEFKNIGDVPALAVEAKQGQKLYSKNNITFDNTEMVILVPKGVLILNVTFNANSLDANGYLDGEDYKKVVTNTLTLNSTDGDNYSVTFNGQAGSDINLSADRKVAIKFEVANTAFKCTVNGNSVENSEEKYQISDIDKITSTIAIHTETLAEDLTEEGAYTLGLISVDTNVGVDGYKQTFELNDEKTEIKTIAKPRIALNDSFFVGENKNTILLGREYKITTKSYALIGSYLVDDFDIEADKSVTYSSQNDAIKFNEKGDVKVDFKIKDDDSICESYTFDVVDEDNEAPNYDNALAGAREKFIDLYKKELVESGTYGEDDCIYKPLGPNEYLALPSMKSLISDNVSSYEDLKYVVYYKTPNGESSYSSNLKIPLNVAGEYLFYVIFEDKLGNKMEQTDFITTDHEGNQTIVNTDYVFRFNILDNAEMKVEGVTKQGKGFIGLSYTAVDFDITGTGYNAKYELYYSDSKDTVESEWTRIYKKSEVSKDYSENGFTYEDLSSIAYDGILTFTPDREGYYRIKCIVSSSASSRQAVEDLSGWITVEGKPTVVKVANHWFRDNIASVIFLSVGTLCLVGIIVLLFVKPKNEENEIVLSRKRRK